MISETSPDGKINTYQYDDFNRLISVKNHKGKIIQHYDYNIVGTDVVKYLEVIPENIHADFVLGTYEAIIESNISWYMEDDQDWIVCDPVEGTGTMSFSIDISTNPNIEPRIGVISIFGVGTEITRTILIEQDGK